MPGEVKHLASAVACRLEYQLAGDPLHHVELLDARSSRRRDQPGAAAGMQGGSAPWQALSRHRERISEDISD